MKSSAGHFAKRQCNNMSRGVARHPCFYVKNAPARDMFRIRRAYVARSLGLPSPSANQ
jgi:hypothetical protein